MMDSLILKTISIRLHNRPKDDMLVAFYQSFKRLNKDKVLVRLALIVLMMSTIISIHQLWT